MWPENKTASPRRDRVFQLGMLARGDVACNQGKKELIWLNLDKYYDWIMGKMREKLDAQEQAKAKSFTVTSSIGQILTNLTLALLAFMWLDNFFH